MQMIGLDGGYNRFDATDGQKFVSIPSVVGSAFTQHLALGDGGEGIRLTAPQDVAVGDAAISFSRFASRREDRAWVQSDDYYNLVLATLSELTQDSGQARIVTGLPVKYYSDKDILIARLKQTHHFHRAGRAAQTVHIPDVRVLMQPHGTLLDEAMDTDGKPRDLSLASGHVGVIDIGGKTTNLLHAYRLADVPGESTHIDVGGWDMVALVREWQEAEYPDLSLRDHEIVNAISARSLRCDGAEHDISEIVETAARALSGQIANAISGLWSLGKLDHILLAGRGSLLVGEFLQQEIPRARKVAHPGPANVAGYWKFGKISFG